MKTASSRWSSPRHAGGEVVLQLSREPPARYVAGGKPDGLRLGRHMKARPPAPFPTGTGAGNRVRIGLAIEAPDATAFFDSASVLVIGEDEPLPAQFSSRRDRAAFAPAHLARLSRSRGSRQRPAQDDLQYHGARHGGSRRPRRTRDRSRWHADEPRRPQLLRPASLHFADAIEVHLAREFRAPLYPATVPVNRRRPRDHDFGPQQRPRDPQLPSGDQSRRPRLLARKDGRNSRSLGGKRPDLPRLRPGRRARYPQGAATLSGSSRRHRAGAVRSDPAEQRRKHTPQASSQCWKAPATGRPSLPDAGWNW